MTISKKRLKEIKAIKDEDIDYSDIPELDERFWSNAKLIEPNTTELISIRVKKNVLNYFKSGGKKGYLSRMNRVLESFVRTQEQDHHQGR